LTHETLPLAGRCCHWQSEVTPATVVQIGDADIAPWLHGSAIDVFAESPSAPPITFADGQIVVALDDWSVPLVYGVPADEWETALGWDTGAPSAWDTPADDGRQQAIMAALAALEQGGPMLATALAELASALEPDGAATLPDGWVIFSPNSSRWGGNCTARMPLSWRCLITWRPIHVHRSSRQRIERQEYDCGAGRALARYAWHGSPAGD
jgi:hypothetical protein